MTAVVVTDDEPPPVVFVTVGTTWHNFARLMRWLESWLLARPGQVRMIVQHGPNPCPVGAEGFAMCSTADLVELMERSDVVVTQGGPGGIMDSRNCGILPIAVPRRPELVEVVDDHQVRFCRHLARSGMIRLAESEEQLHQALDAALADPGALRIQNNGDHVSTAVTRTGQLIDDLVARRRPRHRRRARQA